MLQKLQQLIPFEERTVGRREVLLTAGAVADSVFYIQRSIRKWWQESRSIILRLISALHLSP